MILVAGEPTPREDNMANTIARATGHDSTRTKQVSRLGSRFSSTEAATWRTFARTQVAADGSVEIEVARDGGVIHKHTIGPEGAK
jgi:hypothetical protein